MGAVGKGQAKKETGRERSLLGGFNGGLGEGLGGGDLGEGLGKALALGARATTSGLAEGPAIVRAFEGLACRAVAIVVRRAVAIVVRRAVAIVVRRPVAIVVRRAVAIVVRRAVAIVVRRAVAIVVRRAVAVVCPVLFSMADLSSSPPSAAEICPSFALSRAAESWEPRLEKLERME